MDSLLTRAKQQGTPLIDNDQVTFVWYGEGEQTPTIIGDFTNWEITSTSIPMQRVEPQVWSATITLPQDAYLEYAFVLDGKRFQDPLNRQSVHDGMSNTNSYFYMPQAGDTPLIQVRQDIAHGQLSEHILPSAAMVIGESRQVYLYQPPVDHACPLVVVFDGQDYLYRAYLTTIVDNLIAEKRIEPIALALVANGGVARRVEYACSDTTLAFILYQVLPLAQKQLNLIDIKTTPGAYTILGASMGGLMSLYAGMRMPHIFGQVLCQSGAFGADHPEFRLYYRSVIEDLITLNPLQPIKIWMDAALYEWFIGPNRQMYTRLRERGYDVTYLEHSSGHNYPSWRNSVWKGLEYFFRK